MIMLIVKSYLSILISVGIGSLFVFSFGLYFILKKPKSKKSITQPTQTSIDAKSKVTTETVENLQDVSMISGDDVMATQLDLARAYIETGRIHMAKNILESVIRQGSPTQQHEAQQLMNYT